MSLEEKIYSKNIELQEKLKVEIDNVTNGLSKRDGKQLNSILSELMS